MDTRQRFPYNYNPRSFWQLTASPRQVQHHRIIQAGRISVHERRVAVVTLGETAVL